MASVTTRRERAKGVAERWRKQYQGDDGSWVGHYPSLSQKPRSQTHAELVALGPNPDPDDVNRIIGNNSWTSCRCHQCGKDCDSIVEVGEEPDHESHTADLCAKCAAWGALLAVFPDTMEIRATEAGHMPFPVLADWLQERPDMWEQLVNTLRT